MPDLLCQHCAYDLSGAQSPDGIFVCPECGARTRAGALPRVRIPFKSWAVPMLVGGGLLIGILFWVMHLAEHGPWFVPAVMIACTAGALNGLLTFWMLRSLTLTLRSFHYAAGVALVTALLGLIVASCAGTLGEGVNC